MENNLKAVVNRIEKAVRNVDKTIGNFFYGDMSIPCYQERTRNFWQIIPMPANKCIQLLKENETST